MSCEKCKENQLIVDKLKELLDLLAVNEVPSESKVLDIALGEIGVEEIPRGSNDGKRVREYLRAGGCTVPAPWCAGFVVWCLKQAGIDVFTTAHVATLWDKSKRYQQKTPKKGDVFIQINKNGTGHCGFVVRVEDNHIVTVEGNTNDEGSREGYEVCQRVRSFNTIYGYLRFEEI